MRVGNFFSSTFEMREKKERIKILNEIKYRFARRFVFRFYLASFVFILCSESRNGFRGSNNVGRSIERIVYRSFENIIPCGRFP